MELREGEILGAEEDRFVDWQKVWKYAKMKERSFGLQVSPALLGESVTRSRESRNCGCFSDRSDAWQSTIA